MPNFHKVNNQVYRGGQPTEAGFQKLAKLGIKTVIDLREESEHSASREGAWVESDGMRYISIPLHGLSAPPDDKVSRILSIMDDPQAGPVFIHCRRGADRTGTIVACYRIWHDHWDNRVALEEARGFGMRFFERAMQSYISRYTGQTQPELRRTSVVKAQ